MPIDLYSHNKTAYESALAMLAETGKAAIIHPTGTGKSFIAFRLCEDLPDKTVCWLSPSEYIFRTQLENLRAAEGKEERPYNAPANIKFFTYAKLMNMSGDELSGIRPDYIILDEFHRCGAEQWGAGVKRLLAMYPGSPVLGLSATAIRYLDNRRDMADELFAGNVASEITLGEAIVRGILNPPKYVLSAFSYKNGLAGYERRVRGCKNKAARDAAEKYLEALRRALDKAEGLDVIFDRHMTDRTGKYIIFCANREHMYEMMSRSGEWFGRIDRAPHIYSVYSDDPGAEKEFDAFKADSDDAHLRLLYCIDALNEGIHVKNVSGVILLRPTVSPIIYKQQIGRALSAGDKESGTKNSAVIFDIVMNIDNLFSIDTVKEEMRVAMTYYRFLEENDSIVNDSFEVTDEIRDCRELFERLNDTLTASWDTMFGYAKRYYGEHGNLAVPRRFRTEEGYSLGQWIFTQRKVRNAEQYGCLDEKRIAKLDSIGMIWENVKDAAWERYFTEAVKYKEAHGDLLVPMGTVQNGVHLGCWIANLRTYRKSNIKTAYLTKERVKQLDAIGMTWDVADYIWDRNYGAAAAYSREHGDLSVPAGYVSPEGIRLGAWIHAIRSAKRRGRDILTEEQIKCLDKLGMEWQNRQDAAWNTGYNEAVKYVQAHGNMDIPSGYVSESGYRLGRWTVRQREMQSKLPRERKEKLDRLGMNWETTDPWEYRFRLAEDYFNRYGDLRVPAGYSVSGTDLHKWINEQKQAFYGKRKQKLTDEQIRRLESIGMDWRSASDAAWEKMYQAVKDHYLRHGALNLSEAAENAGVPIDRWILVQRRYYRENKLKDDQIAKLNAVGMVWEVPDAWEKGFAHAKAYYAEHGDLLVPDDHVSGDGYLLGSWINNQRTNHNNPSKYRFLTAEQTKRLERIGMVWNRSGMNWDKAYELARTFYRQHGNLAVPGNYRAENGFRLGSWICTQREKQRDGSLPDEYKSRLDNIGMDWLSPTERAWENYFSAAERYFRAHGNLDVPADYTDGTLCLGAWVNKQRSERNTLKVCGANGNQPARLESIGMTWNEKD